MENKIKSLDDVKNYYASNLDGWSKILRYIDNTLIDARDKQLAPIYLTKSRIKHPESAYLKFKRKRRENPALITDWIGFRVLCLFQQDLEPTFQLLIKLMLNRHPIQDDAKLFFKLKEIKIFNWPAAKAKTLVNLLKSELDLGSLSKTIQEKDDGLDIAITALNHANEPCCVFR